MRGLAFIASMLVAVLVPVVTPARAADGLPMPLAHYADLCRQSGGTLAQQLTSGVGIVQCQWPDHGRTQCKVGGGQVNVCGISCQSNACLTENPARHSPIWPLQGGPNAATLAPSN